MTVMDRVPMKSQPSALDQRHHAFAGLCRKGGTLDLICHDTRFRRVSEPRTKRCGVSDPPRAGALSHLLRCYMSGSGGAVSAA
jgi:hypothetical protein